MTSIEKCFEGSREVPKRLLKVEPSVSKAQEHLNKAVKNLEAAVLMDQNKFFDWSIICAYYSMYHALLSSLWLIGLDARSHECAIAAFETFYVKENKTVAKYIEYAKRAKTLTKKYSDSLKAVKAARINASYGIAEITSSEALKAIGETREFVQEVTRIVFEAKGIGYRKVV